MRNKFAYPLLAAFFVYCVYILMQYGLSYPEVGGISEFAGFVFFFIGAKLLFILTLAASAFGFGGAVFRKWQPGFGSLLEEWLVKTALGLIIISYLMLVSGLIGVLYAPVGYAVLAAGILVGSMDIKRFAVRAASLPRSINVGFVNMALLSVSGYFLIKGFYAALLPPVGFDVLMYHFGAPRLYLDAHMIFPTPDVNGSSFPFGVEMLYMLAMMVEGAISANLVNYAFAIMGGLAAAAFTRRFAAPNSGLPAFAIYVSIPLVIWMMPQAYIELGQAFYTMIGLYALMAALEGGDRKWLITAALILGYTMSIKYTGMIIVGTAGVIILVHGQLAEKAGIKKSFAVLALFAGIAAGVSAPWYIKNIAYYSNPVFPFLAGLFGSETAVMSGAPESFFSGGAWNSISRLVSSLWGSTLAPGSFFQLDWLSSPGPYFLMLIPGVLLFKKVERAVKYIALFCLAFFLIMITKNLVRYLMPIFPALAVIAAYPVGRLLNEKGLPARVAGGVLVALFVVASLFANTGRSFIAAFPSSSRIETDKYYSERPWSGYLASYDTWKWINANLPKNAVIYQLWDDASVYFRERRTIGAALSWTDTGRQRIHHIKGVKGFGGYLAGKELIGNLRGMGADYLLINANREGHALPNDDYFAQHARLISNRKGVFLFQITP